MCTSGTYSSAPATLCSTCPAGNYVPTGELSAHEYFWLFLDYSLHLARLPQALPSAPCASPGPTPPILRLRAPLAPPATTRPTVSLFKKSCPFYILPSVYEKSDLTSSLLLSSAVGSSTCNMCPAGQQSSAAGACRPLPSEPPAASLMHSIIDGATNDVPSVSIQALQIVPSALLARPTVNQVSYCKPENIPFMTKDY